MAKGLFDEVETREGFIDRFDNLQNSVRVRLTADEIRTLNSTPQTLLTAPGPNKFITIDQAIAYLDYSGGAFTGGNDLEIRVTDGTGTVLTEDGFSSGFLNGVADAIAIESGVSYWGEVTRLLDLPIVVVVPVADPGGATSTSTLTIILMYKVIKVYNI